MAQQLQLLSIEELDELYNTNYDYPHDNPLNDIWERFNWDKYGNQLKRVYILCPGHYERTYIYNTYKYLQPEMFEINKYADREGYEDIYYDKVFQTLQDLNNKSYEIKDKQNPEYYVNIGRYYSMLEWFLNTSHFAFILENQNGLPIKLMNDLQNAYFDAFELLRDVKNIYEYQGDADKWFNNFGTEFPIPDEFDDEHEVHKECYWKYLRILNKFINKWEDFYYSETFRNIKTNISFKLLEWYRQRKYRENTIKKLVAFNQLNKNTNLNLDIIQTILCKC